jgi:hypothetical protein
MMTKLTKSIDANASCEDPKITTTTALQTKHSNNRVKHSK